jgi:hypothetical protein
MYVCICGGGLSQVVVKWVALDIVGSLNSGEHHSTRVGLAWKVPGESHPRNILGETTNRRPLGFLWQGSLSKVFPNDSLASPAHHSNHHGSTTFPTGQVQASQACEEDSPRHDPRDRLECGCRCLVGRPRRDADGGLCCDDGRDDGSRRRSIIIITLPIGAGRRRTRGSRWSWTGQRESPHSVG